MLVMNEKCRVEDWCGKDSGHNGPCVTTQMLILREQLAKCREQAMYHCDNCNLDMITITDNKLGNILCPEGCGWVGPYKQFSKMIIADE
jgi:hypothetical protein